MVIDLDSYRKAKSARAAAGTEACEEAELQCVNWNPAVRLVALTSYQRPRELSLELPEDFSKVDMRVFMDRIHALATQI